jgi:radical SAM superfamily enzyme YgiQ (UPF0313 family)
VAPKRSSLYAEQLGREKGTVRKDWGGKVSVALVYPNHYAVGMSNLGFQTVYRLLNGREDTVAERVFLPEKKQESFFFKSSRGLLSTESLAPLWKFDLIAFSLSFEIDYLHILAILDMGRIPLLSRQRGTFLPLVMAGGVTTFLNPEPIAPFVDCFLLGEAETILDPFIDLFKDLKKNRVDKETALTTLAGEVPSLYVPSLYKVIYGGDKKIRAMIPRKSHVPEKIRVAHAALEASPVATSTILSDKTSFSNKVLVELGRGCGRSCRFCAAGYVYRPPRVHEKKTLLECIGGTIAFWDNIGLLSAAVSDTPGIEEITQHIVSNKARFSVSSLRADSLTETLLKHLKKSGQKSVAIAPEGGSERLRKVMNKHLTEEDILKAVEMIARIQAFSLRLYFLIGLPTEEPGDVDAIITLVRAIRKRIINASKERGRIGHIRLSVNCFIPKPFTPFQWHPMEPVRSLRQKQRHLKRELEKAGGIQVSFDPPNKAYIQTLLSQGDRRVGGILDQAWKCRGNWTKTLKQTNFDPDFFVYREKGFDEMLPWDLIEHGILKTHLVKEYKLALKGKESDICHVGDCIRCGVCV